MSYFKVRIIFCAMFLQYRVANTLKILFSHFAVFTTVNGFQLLEKDAGECWGNVAIQ